MDTIIDNEVERLIDVYKSLNLSVDIFKNNSEYLHSKRTQLDPFIFESLKKIYSKTFQTFWNETTTIPYQSDKALIIVERRCNMNLEFCLQNAAYFIRGYAIHIFCSGANLSFVKSVCGPQFNNIHIHPIFKTIETPENGKNEYNHLLKQKSFWNTFNEEHIITLETDSYFLNSLPDTIYTYDYVASMWPWLPNDPGGGGLSYRKCSIMKQICDIEESFVKMTPMQDSFASNGIKYLKKTYSYYYFTEASFYRRGIGTHQWWTFLDASTPNIDKIIKHYLTLAV